MGRRGPKKGEGGRPKKNIDIQLVTRLAAIDCTEREIASAIGVSHTLFFQRKAEPESGIQEAIENGRNQGNASLRRKMHEMAMAGDRTMLIWLSKNRLGYSNHETIETNQSISIKDNRIEIREYVSDPNVRETMRKLAKMIEDKQKMSDAKNVTPIKSIDSKAS